MKSAQQIGKGFWEYIYHLKDRRESVDIQQMKREAAVYLKDRLLFNNFLKRNYSVPDNLLNIMYETLSDEYGITAELSQLEKREIELKEQQILSERNQAELKKYQIQLEESQKSLSDKEAAYTRLSESLAKTEQELKKAHETNQTLIINFQEMDGKNKECQTRSQVQAAEFEDERAKAIEQLLLIERYRSKNSEYAALLKDYKIKTAALEEQGTRFQQQLAFIQNQNRDHSHQSKQQQQKFENWMRELTSSKVKLAKLQALFSKEQLAHATLVENHAQLQEYYKNQFVKLNFRIAKLQNVLEEEKRTLAKRLNKMQTSLLVSSLAITGLNSALSLVTYVTICGSIPRSGWVALLSLTTASMTCMYFSISKIFRKNSFTPFFKHYEEHKQFQNNNDEIADSDNSTILVAKHEKQKVS